MQILLSIFDFFSSTSLIACSVYCSFIVYPPSLHFPVFFFILNLLTMRQLRSFQFYHGKFVESCIFPQYPVCISSGLSLSLSLYSGKIKCLQIIILIIIFFLTPGFCTKGGFLLLQTLRQFLICQKRKHFVFQYHGKTFQ